MLKESLNKAPFTMLHVYVKVYKIGHTNNIINLVTIVIF